MLNCTHFLVRISYLLRTTVFSQRKVFKSTMRCQGFPEAKYELKGFMCSGSECWETKMKTINYCFHRSFLHKARISDTPRTRVTRSAIGLVELMQGAKRVAGEASLNKTKSRDYATIRGSTKRSMSLGGSRVVAPIGGTTSFAERLVRGRIPLSVVLGSHTRQVGMANKFAHSSLATLDTVSHPDNGQNKKTIV